MKKIVFSALSLMLILPSCAKARDNGEGKKNVVYDTVVKIVTVADEASPVASAADSGSPNQRKLTVTNANSYYSMESQAGNTYYARNMFDGNKNTAWAAHFDQLGWDYDHANVATFDISANSIDKIVITNGYAKNSTAYYNNSRPTYIIISRSEYDSQLEEPRSAVLYEGRLSDTSAPQTLQVAPGYRHKPGKQNYSIEIVSTDINYGKKWNDVCISEVEFFGK